MKIEVCYAESIGATRITVELAAPASLADAVDRSGIVPLLQLDRGAVSYAIFGRRASYETVLQEGDRVEILRPLQVDPKEARRRRATKKAAPREQSLRPESLPAR